MQQYFLLIHSNAKSSPSENEWADFFDAARGTGCFVGGSAVGESELLGQTKTENLAPKLAGYMRFDCQDRKQILALLEHHPIVVHGGTVELCELTKAEG